MRLRRRDESVDDGVEIEEVQVIPVLSSFFDRALETPPAEQRILVVEGPAISRCPVNMRGIVFERGQHVVAEGLFVNFASPTIRVDPSVGATTSISRLLCHHCPGSRVSCTSGYSSGTAS